MSFTQKYVVTRQDYAHPIPLQKNYVHTKVYIYIYIYTTVLEMSLQRFLSTTLIASRCI